MDIRVGDVIKMKKKHPCGSFEWEVLRIRGFSTQAEKNIKEIRRAAE